MKIRFSRFTVSAFAIVMVALVTGQFLNNTSAAQKPSQDIITEISTPYDDLWDKVKELQEDGLYASALKQIDVILEKSKNEDNHPQFLKGYIHKIKFNSYIKEDDYVIAIQELDSLSNVVESPLKQFTHSIMAELYWGYFQSHRYQFYNRTELLGEKPKDMRKWDMRTMAEAVRDQYLLSVENPEKLKSVPIKDFDLIIQDIYDHNEKRWPTLYDFLGHRAVDFFMNAEFDVTRPAETFEVNDIRLFAKNKTFAQVDLKTNDSLSTVFYGLQILQNLTAYHLAENNKTPLIEVGLKRLEFVSQNSVLEKKDSMYLMSLKELKEKYPEEDMNAEVYAEIASWHKNKGQNFSSTKDSTYQMALVKAHQIAEDAIDKYPDTKGATLCKNLIIEIEQKELSFQTEQTNVPNQPNLMYLSYRNINKVHARIIKIDFDKWKKIKEQNTKEYYEELSKLEALKSWEIKLDPKDDFQSHSVEQFLPKLEKGHYILYLSANSDFAMENGNALFDQNIWVTNITANVRNHDLQTDVLVLDKMSGKPLKNANVEVLEQKYDYKSRSYITKTVASGKTNDLGLFQFSKEGYSNSYFYKFEHEGDYYYHSSRVYSYSYRNYEQRQEVTHFFTDRAIYRPGQTIHFKGIAAKGLKNDFELLTNHKVDVTFYDVNYQKVKEETFKTNEYGSFSGTFQIPMGLLNGRMRIQSPHGTKYLRVEEYKRPKFEVEMEPLEGNYRVDDDITATGKAIAYAGNVIDGAKVKYTVTRTARYSWHWYWMPYQTSEKVVENGVTTTDDEGKFEVKFKAIPDRSYVKKYKPVFTYQISADVTDINGETHSTTGYVNVGYHNLKLSMYLNSQIDIKTDSLKSTISATNLNGQPLDKKGQLKLYQITIPEKYKVGRYWNEPDVKTLSKSEFEQKAPHMAYDDAYNQEKEWKRTLVETWSFDTGDTNLWKVPMDPSWTTGKYVMVIEAKDDRGENIKNETTFDLFDYDSKKSITSEMITAKVEKSNYEVGDTARIIIASGAQLDQVLASVEHQGKIVDEYAVALQKEQKVIRFPIEEKHKGGVQMHFITQKFGRVKSISANINVYFKEKQLDIEFATFRDKLKPGQQEEWTVTIKGNKGEQLAAEFLATMYDASLDAFASNNYYMNFFSNYYSKVYWSGGLVDKANGNRQWNYDWNEKYQYINITYPHLDWFGHRVSSYYYGGSVLHSRSANRRYDGVASTAGAIDDVVVTEEAESDEMALADQEVAKKEASNQPAPPPAPKQEAAASKDKGTDATTSLVVIGEKEQQQQKLDEVKSRTNFNETAFFYPQLKTNDKGEVVFSFTVPESLTKWKFLGMAHTKDLATGTIIEEAVTQKDLMLFPNAPRFFRENDEMVFNAKIANVSEKDLSGEVRLQLIDPITDKDISEDFDLSDNTQSFEVKAGKSAAYEWKIAIPDQYSTVAYRIVAASDDFSDGEEKPLPVLSNRMLVTESLPLPIKGGQTKTYTFDKLYNSGKSKTLKHHALTLEFTANPAWYAVQALPYMMEYPYECSEQTFSRLYANGIATHIVQSKPEIQKVFEAWKQSSPEAFLSNLEKNQELKTLLLEETPWVLDAKDESERKKRVALLFDMNKMRYELQQAKRKLKDMQTPNGGWPWFKGMRDNRYITQHIVAGYGHLKNLGINNPEIFDANMLRKAVLYLDDRIREDYEHIKSYASNMDDQHISYHHVHYLYARSFFGDIKVERKNQEAVDYFKGQAEKYWTKFNLYAEGMIGLAAHRNDNEKLANKVLNSLKERSLSDEEMGVYWKEYKNGFYWYQAPIETQALMIEFFDEVGDDEGFVDELRVWLLKQKQTQDWKTTKATADACYALLLRGTEWLDAQPVNITIGDTKIVYNEKAGKNERSVETQAGTGYFKTRWDGSEIDNEMGKVHLEKKDKGVAWGALYWQYFEQLDKITPHETPLKINKKLHKVVKTATGEKLEAVDNNLKVGDRVRVRVEIEVDRMMEFVHLKDMRAASFEPVQVISSYQYQDGLGYYQTTKDASTNFFFDRLPKGVYVFEYDLIATIKGDFSNGISTMQCMYAPEFSSHSEGVRVSVK